MVKLWMSEGRLRYVWNEGHTERLIPHSSVIEMVKHVFKLSETLNPEMVKFKARMRRYRREVERNRYREFRRNQVGQFQKMDRARKAK